MSAWRLAGPERWPENNTDAVSVFIAPQADRTFQKAGVLRLTEKEFAELDGKLNASESRDLTAEEYNRLQTFLMEWAEQDTEALYLAEIVRRKFGASSRRGVKQ
jgi:hypothetical protein